MRWRQSFSTILVGKSILLREGLAGILHSADFRILASVSRADDLLASKLQQQQQQLFIVVHTGDDFAAAIEQIELFREQHPGGRIAVVADHYRLDELVSALRAGANGYFADVMTCDAFIKSMELPMMGEQFSRRLCHSFSIPKATTSARKSAPLERRHRATKTTRRSSSQQTTRSRRSFLRGRNQFCAA